MQDRLAAQYEITGIDLGSAAPGSLGIPGMRERIERLGGELTVARGEHRGTAVLARIPVERTRSGPGVEDTRWS